MNATQPDAMSTSESELDVALVKYERALDSALRRASAVRMSQDPSDIISALRASEAAAAAAQVLLVSLARTAHTIGFSHRRVAAELQVSPTTVLRWMKSTPPPSFWTGSSTR